MKFSDARPGTIEHDILMPDADARHNFQCEVLYSLINQLLEAARLEGVASVTEALRSR